MVAWDEAGIRTEVRQFRALAAFATGASALAMLLLMLLQVRFGLQPMAEVRRGLQAVQRGEQRMFDVDRLPREVQPLAGQINQLLDGHQRQVLRARHSADDLAHALKTPLAILAAESQRPGDDFPRVVAEQVARLHTLVERRLASAAAIDPHARTPVLATVTALQRVLVKAHPDRVLNFESRIDAEAVFAGAADDLEEMLGNLIDNACKWSAGQVRIVVSRSGARIRISIEDDGPGLPDDRAEAVLERGVRLDERTPGSGHGLSIVAAIVEAYGGSLHLERSALGGLRAHLDLPAA
jgi:signal transduction histidine kinase